MIQRMINENDRCVARQQDSRKTGDGSYEGQDRGRFSVLTPYFSYDIIL